MEAPATRKFFISHLFQCSVLGDALQVWEFRGERFTDVHIQGTVIGTADGWFLLDDSTGVVRVVCPVDLGVAVRVGLEVAVIGRPAFSFQDHIFEVNATRLFNKGSDPNSELLWMIEVMHVHRLVYSVPI